MKHAAIILLTACGVAGSLALARAKLPQPKYLSVPGFKSCLETESRGTWQSWCIPEQKPQQCVQSSWDALVALHNAGELEPCGGSARQGTVEK